ncbi:MAG TPA: hypothetical protein VEC57_10900 [Candidatus Limnocylindrales bacterium]|nr:hypothetical protein [Candidatus Limnocylindrales bacterium]
MNAARNSAVAVSSTRHGTADFLELVTRTATLDPEERGLRRRLVLLLCLSAVLLAGHVWVRMQAHALGYQSDALGRIVNRLDQERMELEMAAARESSPALLAVRARELGMQKAGLGQLRRLEPDAKP